MGKKIALLTILVFVFIGMSFLPLKSEVVKASGTVYIRADGSVEPVTASVEQHGNVYTLIGDINDSIVVERSNIVFDGVGYGVQGTGSGKGIDISGRNNVTIKNTKIRTFDTGVYLYQSSSNMITGNNITNSTLGIKLDYYSSSDSISGNSITENRRGIAVGPVSSNNEIYGNYLSNMKYLGIFIETDSNNNSILENSITNSIVGIRLVGYSNYNSIVGNNITNNLFNGIQFLSCSNNSIHGNNITGNGYGLNIFYGSHNNTVSGNDIMANTECGILLNESENNSILHNNFVENQRQVSPSEFYNNLWDDGVEGNFWSSYPCVDSNQDGIGDSPHVIDAKNQDNHPLVGVFSSFNTIKGYCVNVVSNSSIEDFQYLQSNSTIRMHVSNITANQAFGFCRICIPHAVMNETYHVTVDGAEPHYVNYTVYDDGNNRWIYFNYQHSTHEIVIVPEFIWLIPSLLIATTPILVMVCGKKHSAQIDRSC